MEKIKTAPLGTGPEVERALTPAERRKILDAADYLPVVGGCSKKGFEVQRNENVR